jgi:hypothetical protein
MMIARRCLGIDAVMPIRVVTDADDTITSSGGLSLAGIIPLGGVDVQYKRSASELAAPDSPRLLSVRSRVARRSLIRPLLCVSRDTCGVGRASVGVWARAGVARRHTIYPGVTSFYLALSRHGASPGDAPLPVAMITARPTELKVRPRPCAARARPSP